MVHQDVESFEERFHGRLVTAMLGHHCWRLLREDTSENKGKS